MKRVAIIGAGPAGLVSAKECLDQGFNVTVFEKQEQIGGLWNSDTGHVWEGMRANLSRDTCRFSDFDYQHPVDMFPKQSDIATYLRDFLYHFRLLDRADFKFGCAVKNVEKDDGGWLIQSNGQSYHFDAVVVASGFFSKAYIPDFLGQENFSGDITHSSLIQNFSFYQGKDVHVIGNGFSGCDIVVGLANAGANVTHIFRRPYWYLSREIEFDGQTHPIDHFLYEYPDEKILEPEVSLAEQFQQSNKALFELCWRQTQANRALFKSSDSLEPPYVAITDGYLEKVKSGKIVLSVCDNINLARVRADHIISATGFKTDLSFLSLEILDHLKYDCDDPFMPALIGQSGLHPDLEGLSFVGMYKGPYFLTMGLQAQIAAKQLSGEKVISDVNLNKEIERADHIRNQNPRPQFPYGEYVNSSLALAKILGIHTPQEGIVLPQHFVR